MFRSRYFCDRVMIVIFCSLWYRMVSSLSEVALLYMVAVLYYPYQTDVIPVVANITMVLYTSCVVSGLPAQPTRGAARLTLVAIATGPGGTSLGVYATIESSLHPLTASSPG